MDCNMPGSSVQTRILEWVAVPFSRASSQPRDWNLGLLHSRQILYCLSHQEALLSPGVCSNSCPLSWWCYLTILSSEVGDPCSNRSSASIGLFFSSLYHLTLVTTVFFLRVFQMVLVVKNPPTSAGDIRDAGSIPGSRRFPRGGNGNPLQCSCLENPTDRGRGFFLKIPSPFVFKTEMPSDSSLPSLRLLLLKPHCHSVSLLALSVIKFFWVQFFALPPHSHSGSLSHLCLLWIRKTYIWIRFHYFLRGQKSLLHFSFFLWG